MRIYSVIAHHCKKQNLFNQGNLEESNLLLTHFLNQINEYSQESHPVFVKYEWLNLIGIIYNLHAPIKNHNAGTKPKIIGEAIQPAILKIMNRYFPIWSHELKPDTREKRHYEMIFDGITNLIAFSKNPMTLKLLYSVIREEKTLLEDKLTQILHVLITKGINKLCLADFLIHWKMIFSEFIDFDGYDEGKVSEYKNHNAQSLVTLKFGIAERWILKIFKTCSFEYLTPIINELAPKLIKILQEDFITENIYHLMYQLKER